VRKNIVLIDSENVQPDSIERLKQDHIRVFVFVGANQTRIDIGIVKAVQGLGTNGDYIQISGNGPNALDFHIAYYIGKYAASQPDAYFHIISKDKGFDPLIKHLKEQKIFCSRSASIKDIPLLKATEKLSPEERGEHFYELRVLGSKNRPGTITRLKNAVAAHFLKQLSEDDVSAVIKALQVAGRIMVSGQRVTYPEHG
jgi:hypothetical protein